MLGFGRKKGFRSIPYEMFDGESFGLAARNARILERVYHKGHRHGWDGKEVLNSLVEEHGKPRLPEATAAALSRVFGVIMWGELAAWRISAELADEIEPLEPKMAATSQAYDEARHFYVMHDYLEMLGLDVHRLDWGARRLLEDVMNADHLAKKLVGMQLMVEPVALTLFHVVKKLDVEPVLTHLLPYYERDESRHVALGIQYLPAVISQMSSREQLELWAFQMKMLTYEIWSNMDLSRDLQLLGVSPRELLELGKGKQTMALELMLEALGVANRSGIADFCINRYADVMSELTLLPEEGEHVTMALRLQRAAEILRHGAVTEPVELTPDISNSQVPLIQSNKDKATSKPKRARSTRRKAS